MTLKVASLAELFSKAGIDKQYEELLLAASENLGGSKKSVEKAKRHLHNLAIETTEEGVVEEVNFVAKGIKVGS